MSLVRSYLCIVIISLIHLCFSREEFRCKAVAGCEIARCDPSPLSWAPIDRNEFPINCVSDDASKEKRCEEKVKALESKVEGLAEEMKEQIREVQQDQKETSETPTQAIAATPLPSTTPRVTAVNEWTVFQRRQDGSVSFDRAWDEYVKGFGKTDGEFWMGLEKLHQATSSGHHELRIELGDWEGNKVYAQYSKFSVGSASTNYRLKVSGYSGTAGDSLTGAFSKHNGMAFSTYNSDNDPRGDINCAEVHKGGWRFNDCLSSNLNGIYYHGGKYNGHDIDGIVWHSWKKSWWDSMKFVEMKLRPGL